MKKKTLYKTTIHLDILSEHEITPESTFDKLINKCYQGDYLGSINPLKFNRPISGTDAVGFILDNNGDIEKFNISMEGNDTSTDEKKETKIVRL